MAPADPSRRQRYAFWLLLSILSTYYAEVTCANQPFAFFLPLGTVLMMTLYGLHTVVLMTVALRPRRAGFATLYLAGTIFGMYEAYVTKMIWTPEGEAVPFRIGGVAVGITLELVLFWHAFMAFIVPLLLAERQLLASDEVWRRLPRWLARWRDRRLPLIALAVLCGALHGALAHKRLGFDLAKVLASSGGCSAVVVLAIYLWGRRGATRAGLAQLLPSWREWAALLAVLLVGVYGGMGLMMSHERPGALPGWRAQATVWIIYAVLLGLLAWTLRCPPPAEKTAGEGAARVAHGWRHQLLYSAVFVAVSALAHLTLRAKPTFVVLFVTTIPPTAVLLLGIAIRLAARTLARLVGGGTHEKG